MHKLFHQYKTNKQPHLTLKSLNTKNTRTCGNGNPGSSLGQTQTFCGVKIPLCITSKLNMQPSNLQLMP